VSEEEESQVTMRRRTKQQEKNEIEKKRKERGLPARMTVVRWLGRRWSGGWVGGQQGYT
jgi:hypothetical protein